MLSEYLTDLAQCTDSTRAVNMIHRYLRGELHGNFHDNIRMFVRLICFRHQDVEVYSGHVDAYSDDENEQHGFSLDFSVLSDFFVYPTVDNFNRILWSDLSTDQKNTFRDIVFTQKFTNVFRTSDVYDALKSYNMPVECMVGEGMDVVENCLFATGSIEYGMPVAGPLYKSTRHVSNLSRIVRDNINMQNVAEIFPDDYIMFQLHYSKARGIVVYDSDLKLVTRGIDKFNGLFEQNILSAILVVYHSLRSNETRVSDILYLNTIGLDVDLRLQPLWRRINCLRQYFSKTMTTYCDRTTGKKDYCVIFKDKSSKFLFTAEYDCVRHRQTEVCITAGVSDLDCDYVSRYNLTELNSKNSPPMMYTINVMDLGKSVREYLLYSLRPVSKCKTDGITVVHFDENVRVFGNCIINKRIGRKSFRVSRVLKKKM